MLSSNPRAALAARKPFAARGFKSGIARNDGAPSLADVLLKVGQIQEAVAAFQRKNDELEAAVKAKGTADVITKEEVDRVNADITRLTHELKEMNSKLETAKALGKSDKRERTPEQEVYNASFMQYFRRGIDNGLGDLGVKAAMTTDSNPDGGYVIPEEADRAIQRVLGKTNGMRQIASVRSIGTDTLTLLKNLGGASAGWVAEKDARPQTNNSQLAKLEFKTHEMYAMPAATQQVLDDAFTSIEGFLEGEGAIAFSDLEGDSLINGSGVGKPHGLIGGYSFAASTAASPSAWGKLGFTKSGSATGFIASSSSVNGIDRLLDLQASLKPGYLGNARWLMNRTSESVVRKLKDADGNYVWQVSTQVGNPNTLLGYPIALDDDMPNFEDGKYPIAFGDFARGYLIVDRMGTRLLRDPFTAKPYVLFYMTKRVGGGVQDFHAMKFLKSVTD